MKGGRPDISLGKLAGRWAGLKLSGTPRKTYIALRITPDELKALQTEARKLKVGYTTLAHAVLVEWLTLRQKAKGGGKS